MVLQRVIFAVGSAALACQSQTGAEAYMMKNKQVPKKSIEELRRNVGGWAHLPSSKELNQTIMESYSNDKETRKEALSDLEFNIKKLLNRLINLYTNWEDGWESGLKEKIINYDQKKRQAGVYGWNAAELRTLTKEIMDTVKRYEKYIDNGGVQKGGGWFQALVNRVTMTGSKKHKKRNKTAKKNFLKHKKNLKAKKNKKQSKNGKAKKNKKDRRRKR